MIALALALAVLAGSPDGGSERALAQSALSAARSAVRRAPASVKGRDEAAARLEQAETLFEGGRYGEAAKAADAAWQLVSTGGGEPTRFAVQVSEDGKTTVIPRTGKPVHVEAMGTTQAVYPGQSVNVERGQPPLLDPPPQERSTTLEAPALVSPDEAAEFRMKPSPKGLGPVRASWTPVAGATSYEVEIVPASGEAKPLLVTAAKPEAKLPPLAAGKYRWWVRAVGPGANRSPASNERTFELQAEDLKLDVKTDTWK